MSDLLTGLNDAQRSAATHGQGPLLIVAGAGTGKTTVITKRIAHLVEQKLARTDEILALTFTEKAAGEMEERLDQLLPYGYLDLWISTFHGFGERILTLHGLDIGLNPGGRLLNEFEQWALIRKHLDEFALDYYRPLGNPVKFIGALLKHFSRLKDENITPAQYLEYAEGLKQDRDAMLSGATGKKKSIKYQVSSIKEDTADGSDQEAMEMEIARINELANAYHIYNRLLRAEGVMDFGDLINETLRLFRERPAILDKYRKQFKYILLDEFQDTNWAQYELIKLLAAPANNLVVVGDDDQCLPGSTLVSTPDGDKRIDKIKAGDQVLTAVGKGYLSGGTVTKVMHSRKKARLLTFTTAGGRTVTATDNHKFFCYVPMSPGRGGEKRYYVYLMEKTTVGWRIGITNDLATRLRLERSADRLVAIASFATEAEARYHETLWSLKYGIPTVCFQERNGIMDKPTWSERLYRDLNVGAGVARLAFDLGIRLDAHQVSLGAVRRGGKTRIKAVLEMNFRRYRSKYARRGQLLQPQVSHQLQLQTSDEATLSILESAGYKLTEAKRGKRLRLVGADLLAVGRHAARIVRLTGAILDVKMSVGTANIQHKPALVIPAGNVFPGMYLPVAAPRGVVYERVIERRERTATVDLYDLEVARSHNFIAAGIVVHNSIYKFRGASVANIIQFKRDYPQAKEVVLTENYRNKQAILDLSYAFIKQNDPNRLECVLNEDKTVKKTEDCVLSKALVARRGGEAAIAVITAATQAEEYGAIAAAMADLRMEGKADSWNDVAVLVRSNETAREVCAALERAGIPVLYFASRGLYTKPAVMDSVAYLKLLDNYHENQAVYRVLCLPCFGFTPKELSDLTFAAQKKAWSLYSALKDAPAAPETRAKAEVLLRHIARHSELAKDKGVLELYQIFLNESGYLNWIQSRPEAEAREHYSHLNQFARRLERFEAGSDDRRVRAFLGEFALELDAGENGALAPDPDAGPEAVRVMTMHAAKGLEFRHVFLPSLVDKRFPTIERKEPIPVPDALVKEMVPEGDIHLEEERRLAYVAMTRAADSLTFSWAPDYGGARPKKPSRFLAELGLVAAASAPARAKAADATVVLPERAAKPLAPELPTYFSFSKLTAFLNCPYQYRFSYILKVPTRNKHYFSFGKTMHAALQRIFELVRDRRVLNQGDLFNAAVPDPATVTVPLDEALRIFAGAWIDDWYESAVQKDEYRAKGKAIITRFLELHNGHWPDTRSLEQGFKSRLRDGTLTYTVGGTIDRIDLSGGALHIVDYKTGAPKEKLDFDEKLQLLIYQLAARELFREPVGSLTFYYLENNTPVTFLGTEAELAKVEEKVIGTIREIRKNEFPPKPGVLCRFCDFFDICEFRSA